MARAFGLYFVASEHHVRSAGAAIYLHRYFRAVNLLEYFFADNLLN